jgi:hypothetical protein
MKTAIGILVSGVLSAYAVAGCAAAEVETQEAPSASTSEALHSGERSVIVADRLQHKRVSTMVEYILGGASELSTPGGAGPACNYLPVVVETWRSRFSDGTSMRFNDIVNVKFNSRAVPVYAQSGTLMTGQVRFRVCVRRDATNPFSSLEAGLNECFGDRVQPFFNTATNVAPDSCTDPVTGQRGDTWDMFLSTAMARLNQGQALTASTPIVKAQMSTGDVRKVYLLPNCSVGASNVDVPQAAPCSDSAHARNTEFTTGSVQEGRGGRMCCLTN